MGLSDVTIRTYLKKGTKLGWCNYNAKDESQKNWVKNSKKNNERRSKKVICLETNIIYDSITIAKQEHKSSHISECCNGKRNIAGGYRWMYYDEYLKQNNSI